MDGVVLLREGHELPLFLPHCGIGDVHYASHLAQYIDANIPIYGLSHSVAEKHAVQSIEAIAARMVRMIQSVQSHGPYRLAGWSVGAQLAYEIATQLIGQAETVSFLGIINTRCINLNDYPKAIEELLEHLRALASADQPRGYQQSIDEDSIQREEEICPVVDYESFYRLLLLAFRPSREIDPIWLQQIGVSSYSGLRSLVGYAVQPITVPIHLFILRKTTVEDEYLDWDSVLPKSLIKINPIAGASREVFSGPQVEKLGESISSNLRGLSLRSFEQLEGPESSFIQLQNGKESVCPLICLPGAGASVTSFMELVATVDNTVPVYGFLARGMDFESIPHSAVSAAARAYIDVLDKRYPGKSFHLVGHSFGGWIAFEMAKQLTKVGRLVSSLTIIDSAAPDDSDLISNEYSNTEAVMAWVEVLELILKESLKISPEDLNALNEGQQRSLLHGILEQKGLMPKRSSPDVLRGPLRTFATCLRTSYYPDGIYRKNTSLVLADDPRISELKNFYNQARTLRRWKRWIPSLSYTHATGDHISILKRPHVECLGRIIERQYRNGSS